MESEILGFVFRNTAQGIRRPTNDWNPEPKFHWQRLEYNTRNPESTAWNPESKPALIPLHGAKSSRNQSMDKYRIYIQWSRLPEPTGTKTSHVSFISFDIFKLTPLDTLPLRRRCNGCWHFLEGQYFTPSKARCFGQITISLPFSSNKPTRASISSFSEATHDCVVCNSLKCAFTSLTQEFKGKNCVRSGYLVDTSHALVQCTAKEHENCDIVYNERTFHLCIVCL